MSNLKHKCLQLFKLWQQEQPDASYCEPISSTLYNLRYHTIQLFNEQKTKDWMQAVLNHKGPILALNTDYYQVALLFAWIELDLLSKQELLCRVNLNSGFSHVQQDLDSINQKRKYILTCRDEMIVVMLGVDERFSTHCKDSSPMPGKAATPLF